MKGAFRGENRGLRPGCPPPPVPASEAPGRPPGKPRSLPLSQASFLKFGRILILTSFLSFLCPCPRCQGFDDAVAFYFKTAAFKPPLISGCFMFAGFRKVRSGTLGGRLPSYSLLCCRLGGAGPRSSGWRKGQGRAGRLPQLLPLSTKRDPRGGRQAARGPASDGPSTLWAAAAPSGWWG